MDRLKSARASTSGRIEGMSKVASSSSSWWKRLFGGSTAPIGDEDEGDDEGLIWGGQGPFKWEDIDGVEVEWGCSALGMVKVGKDAMSSGKDTAVEEGDGLDDVKKFLSEI
jgi:signal recognition particle receptor subunit beta